MHTGSVTGGRRRAVTPESGLGLNSGLESSFSWTRNWPGMAGLGIGIGPECAASGLGLGAESSRVHLNEN